MKLKYINMFPKLCVSCQVQVHLYLSVVRWRSVHLFAVKFLREVTPYFRKASIISEVGWELQRAFLCPLGPGANISPPAPRSPPRADTRYIPLLLTHLARNLKHHDPGTRVEDVRWEVGAEPGGGRRC